MAEQIEVVAVGDDVEGLFSSANEKQVAMKKEHDMHRRTQDAAKTAELMGKIHCLREELYNLRWEDYSAQKKADLVERFAELHKLELELDACKRESTKAFELSLGLEGLGLRSSHMRMSANSSGGSSEIMRTSGPSRLLVQEQNVAVMNAHEQLEQADLEKLKMMRVKSCEVVGNRSPAERFSYLYDMYSKGHAAHPGPDRDDQEIARLRQQIHNLKEHTHLTTADKALLAEFQAKLRAATGHNL